MNKALSVARPSLLGAIMLGASIVGAEARIESFSPSGYAKDASQVAVRFSEAMVALGDPDRSDPFIIRCAVPGTGRWIDERNWVYDFDYDVPGAESCGFTLRRRVRTLAGERIAGPREHRFHTGGPSILRHAPDGTIDERQVFLLALDADADPDSLREHVGCRVEGRGDLGIALVEGDARTEILDALAEHSRHTLDGLIREARMHLPPAEGDAGRSRALQRIASLRCEEDLPGGAKVNLLWGAGVAGHNGLAGESDQILAFEVTAFRANVYHEHHDGWLPVPMYIWFGTPMAREFAHRFRIVDSAGRTLAGRFEESAEIRRIDFPGPFREETDYRLELTGPIHDIEGRPLANAATFPREFRTSRLPPGATFGDRLRVVEALDPLGVPVLVRRPSDLPIVVRRTRAEDDSELLAWLRRINAHMRDPARYADGWPAADASIFEPDVPAERFGLPLADPDAPFQIAPAPLARNGFHVLELALPWAQDVEGGRYVSAGVLATGLGVHFLHGRGSSLVWVTKLADASPVPGADIRITDPCSGQRLWVGRTDASGIARVDQPLPVGEECPDFRDAFLVSARTQADFGYVMGNGRRYEGAASLRPHTILDRSLFQPGETVSMKHVLRHATPDGLGLPPGLPKAMEVAIRHSGTGETHSQTIDVDETGTALGTFELPKEATLGHYTIEVRLGEQRRESGQFRVENFKAQTMRATVDGPAGPLVRPSSVPLTLSVKHLAGGGAAHQEIDVRTRWYDRAHPGEPVARVAAATLDKNGEAAFVVEELGSPDTHAMLFVEFDYADANGQIATASGFFDLWPAALELRIEPVASAPSGARALHIVALGVDGKPVVGQEVQASLFSLVQERHQKRLPGGFRASSYLTDKRHEADCSGRTDADGILECAIPPHVDGIVRVEAVARDEEGNAAKAQRSIWPDSNFLETDEHKLHMPGERAAVAVASPFAKATALVSVHGDGVLDAFVTELDGPQSVVEIPIRRGYADHVNVSVLAVRGREPGTKPPWSGPGGEVFAEVHGDLASYDPLGPGGPDVRHDTVLVQVAYDTHRLTVDVVPERDTYPIREDARVGIRVTEPGGAPASNAEVALVAIDEGLADLWPNWSWNILAMILLRPVSEVTATSGLRELRRPLRVRSLVGGSDLVEYTVSFGLGAMAFDSTYQIGVNADAAPDSAQETNLRHRLDHLLLWRGRVALDKDGTAEVVVPLNDLVTSFRIVAVATAGADLFGTGEATIRTTRNLVLQAGLPPRVREGDRFDATFSLRNATESEQTVAVVAEAEGLPKLGRQSVTLPAGVSKDVTWRVSVPSGVEHLAWDVTAVSEAASDRLAARQSVVPLTPVRVQQATLGQLGSPLEWSVKPPRRALRGRGGASVSLRPTILGGLDTMREAMARYRFSCLEQKVSVAVALDDPTRWSALMASLGTSMDRDGLLRFFPTDRLHGSPVLTAYILTIADAAGWTLPETYRGRMIQGLAGYLDRRVERDDDFPGTAGILTRLGVLAALARHGAADVEMLDGLDLDLELIPTSALLDWIDILDRLAPERAQLDTAKQVLRSRLNLQGTTLGFSTEYRDRLWWLMVSTDANAARAVAVLVDDVDWRTDMPRMVRGLFGRQRHGRWETTVANAWGAVATARFADVFEAESVSGTTLVTAGQAQHRWQWPNDDAAAADRLPKSIEIPWSAAESLALRHEGSGAPWALVELRAAVPVRRAVRRGYRITRTVRPVVGETRRGWHRGDVAEVEVTVDADSDMTWVVVEDPLPPGAVVLGSGLGADSAMLAARVRWDDRWPVFTERGFDSYRAYYRYIPKGRFSLRYTVRYNSSGTFALPPTRVEAMYAPEMHGERPVKPVTIK